MLEEYPGLIARDALLTPEERMRLTAENRARANGTEQFANPPRGNVDLAEHLQQGMRAQVNGYSHAKDHASDGTASGRPFAERSMVAQRETTPPVEETHTNSRVPYGFATPAYIRGTTAVALEAYADPLYDDDETPDEADALDARPCTDVRVTNDTAEWEEDETDEETQAPMRRVRPRTVRGRRFRDFMKPKFHARTASAAKAVLLGSCAMFLVGIVIYGRVQTNEVYSEIADVRAQYDDACAQNVSMQSEMEGKMTVKNVEDYAENVLGLKHLDQSQIEYIQLQTEDEVQVAEPETNFFLRIREQILAIWESLRGA